MPAGIQSIEIFDVYRFQGLIEIFILILHNIINE